MSLDSFTGDFGRSRLASTASDVNTNAASAANEERALSAEKRVAHLTALLSDSETENARLTQLADVLKEEIRKFHRAEERKKHIENSEYVKNIILKVRTTCGTKLPSQG